MTLQQSAMERAALSWSRADSAEAVGLDVATVVRVDGGQTVFFGSILVTRASLEAKRVKFVDGAPLAGAVYGGLRAG